MNTIINEVKKDLKSAAETMNEAEARYLVDMYYQVQKYRIATNNQCRSMNGEPHECLNITSDIFDSTEKLIKNALDIYTDTTPVGRWCKSIKGIGPVLTAGLLAHIDITKAKTAGAIWNYAGLNPAAEWHKGQKRPWNARLKTICWKIGQSFVKVKGYDDDIYGHIYAARKLYETEKNENGEYAEEAKKKLEKFKMGKTTEAYKYYSSGKLPPAHIQQRAERYATKIFLSHLFEVMYKEHYKTDPPKPFAIAILNHAHIIEAPNLHILEH